jgi:hypothetical protein
MLVVVFAPEAGLLARPLGRLAYRLKADQQDLEACGRKAFKETNGRFVHKVHGQSLTAWITLMGKRQQHQQSKSCSERPNSKPA